MNSGSKVLLGVLAGAAAGAVLGVLFAPNTGVETRRKLGEGSKDIANNLKDKFSELVDGIADKYESAREGASDLINKGKEKASSIAENFGHGNSSNANAGSTDANRPSYQS
jgi:gas vesicle protein